MKAIRSMILSALLAVCALSAQADNYQYLTVSGTDGDTSFAVSSIQRITFTATTMELHMTDGRQESLPLSSLSRMFFTAESLGIAPLTPTQSKLHFAGGVLRADLGAGERVTLYSMKGEQVFTTNVSGTYDLTRLTKGVYIVKVGNETKKVINK